MNWLRRYKKHIILAVVVVFIGTTFGSFGRDLFTGTTAGAAIVVDQEKVSRKRFDQLMTQVMQDRQSQGTALNPGEQEWLKRQVVQALVQEAVFMREADRYGVVVSDVELSHFIQTVPAFQKNGQFDPAAYQQVLAQNRLTIPQFESDQRRQLRMQKTQFLMASGVHVSSLELPRRMQERMAKIDLVLKGGPKGLEKFPEENPEHRPAGDVIKRLQAERATIVTNPAQFREQLRNNEIRASLQEWYSALNTTLKIKINVDNKPAAS